jgi:hypothetical protein
LESADHLIACESVLNAHGIQTIAVPGATRAGHGDRLFGQCAGGGIPLSDSLVHAGPGVGDTLL